MASRSRCLTCRLNHGVELRKSVAQEPGLLSLEQSPQWHGCCFGQGAEEAQVSPLQKQLRGGGGGSRLRGGQSPRRLTKMRRRILV